MSIPVEKTLTEKGVTLTEKGEHEKEHEKEPEEEDSIDDELQDEIMALHREIVDTRVEATTLREKTRSLNEQARIVEMVNKTMRSLAGSLQSFNTSDEEGFERNNMAIKDEMHKFIRTGFGMMGQEKKGRLVDEKIGEVLDVTLGLLGEKFRQPREGAVIVEEEPSLEDTLPNSRETLESLHLRYLFCYQKAVGEKSNETDLHNLVQFLDNYHLTARLLLQRDRSESFSKAVLVPQVESSQQSDT
jgi:hypothetical protein